MSDSKELSDLTVKDLRQLAGEHDIPNRSRLAREDLIQALSSVLSTRSSEPEAKTEVEAPADPAENDATEVVEVARAAKPVVLARAETIAVEPEVIDPATIGGLAAPTVSAAADDDDQDDDDDEDGDDSGEPEVLDPAAVQGEGGRRRRRRRRRRRGPRSDQVDGEPSDESAPEGDDASVNGESAPAVDGAPAAPRLAPVAASDAAPAARSQPQVQRDRQPRGDAGRPAQEPRRTTNPDQAVRSAPSLPPRPRVEGPRRPLSSVLDRLCTFSRGILELCDASTPSWAQPRLSELLAEAGLAPIPASGQPHPEYHEVVGTVPAAGVNPGEIAVIEAPGFALRGDRGDLFPLRKAKVRVAAGEVRQRSEGTRPPENRSDDAERSVAGGRTVEGGRSLEGARSSERGRSPEGERRGERRPERGERVDRGERSDRGPAPRRERAPIESSDDQDHVDTDAIEPDVITAEQVAQQIDTGPEAVSADAPAKDDVVVEDGAEGFQKPAPDQMTAAGETKPTTSSPEGGRRRGRGRDRDRDEHGPARGHAVPADVAPPLPLAMQDADELAGLTKAEGFRALGMNDQILADLARMGFMEPTGIQEEAIPAALSGVDLIGQAQTGTGKTAAFVLPILQRLYQIEGDGPIALVLSPTRELARQIYEAFIKMSGNSGARAALIYGGVSMDDQFDALDRKPHVVIGTPGRIIDHMKRRTLDLSRLSVAVLDEADQMLDIGFWPDVTWIISHTPPNRQTLLFSATFPDPIRVLAEKYMRDPQHIRIKPAQITVENVDQKFIAVDHDRKTGLLAHFIETQDPEQLVVFCRTKHQTDRVAEVLKRKGKSAGAIHGDLPQNKRERMLQQFRDRQLQCLIATNVAARGLDIPNVSHVVNYDIPEHAEDYVHRIGRTARNGARGVARTFITPEDGQFLIEIEKHIGMELEEEAIDGFTTHQAKPEAKRSIAQMEVGGSPRLLKPLVGGIRLGRRR